MRNILIIPLLAVLVTTAAPVKAGYSPALSSATAAACDSQFYAASFEMKAATKWRWLNLGGVNIKVPYNADWKVMKKSLPVFEKTENGATKIYAFGKVDSSPFEGCGAFRTYVLNVETGNSYKPGFQQYEAWVEKVGNNVVTFYQATGDRDTLGARAVILKRGKVIVLHANTDGWTKEAKAILASIN